MAQALPAGKAAQPSPKGAQSQPSKSMAAVQSKTRKGSDPKSPTITDYASI